MEWSAKTGVQGVECRDCSEGNQKGPLKNLQQLKHVSARTADPSMREEATGVERLQNLDVWKRKGGAIVLANSTAPLAVLVLHSFWFNCALGSFYFRNFAVQFVYWRSQFQYLFVELGS